MTGFGKTHVVHTSDFAHLEIIKMQKMIYRFETFKNDKRI